MLFIYFAGIFSSFLYTYFSFWCFCGRPKFGLILQDIQSSAKNRSSPSFRYIDLICFIFDRWLRLSSFHLMVEIFSFPTEFPSSFLWKDHVRMAWLLWRHDIDLQLLSFWCRRRKKEDEDLGQRAGHPEEDGDTQEVDHLAWTDLVEAYIAGTSIPKMTIKRKQMTKQHRMKWKDKEKCIIF